MKSPFKLLDAFDKADKDIFFGRTEEIDFLYQATFQADLVLVYGKSGTGKTSLVQCGLANRFRENDWFEIFVRRKKNLNEALFEAILQKAQTPVEPGTSIPDAVHSVYLDYLRPVYLIFDQLEELFILGSKEEQQKFIQSIAQLLDSGVSAKILFVIREEYLAHLYDFEREVRDIFRKRIRIETMGVSNVVRVITGLCDYHGIELREGEETAKLIADYVTDGQPGANLSYLQVYLDKLYGLAAKEPGNAKKIVFSNEIVNQTGALGNIMANFLQNQAAIVRKTVGKQFPKMPENAIFRVLQPFTTLAGTKNPVRSEEIIESIDMPDDLIRAALLELENNRIIRRQDDVYELSHDSLAPVIVEKLSEDDITRIKIQRMVVDRYESYYNTGVYLSPEELQFIDGFSSGVQFQERHAKFVEKSRRIAKVKNRSRMAIILAIFLALSCTTIYAFVQKVKSDENYAAAIAAKDSAQMARDFAEEQRLIAESNEIEAQCQTELADERAIEAEIAEGKARAAEKNAENKALEALAAKEFALAAEQGALKAESTALALRDTALALRDTAKIKESIAKNLRDLSISKSLAIKAPQLGDDTLKALLAMQAYNIHVSSKGNSFSPDHFIGLNAAQKALRGEDYNSHRGHRASIRSIVPGRTGNSVFTAGAEGKIFHWIRNGSTFHPREIFKSPYEIHVMDLAPKDDLLSLAGTGPGVHVLKMTGADTSHFQLNAGNSHFYSLLTLQDGRYLLGGADDGRLVRWNLETGAHRVLHTYPSPPVNLTLNAGDDLLAVVTSAGKVHLLNLSDERDLGLCDIPNVGAGRYITCATFVGEENLLLLGTREGPLLLVPIGEHRTPIAFRGHTGQVTHIDLNHDKTLIASSSMDHTVRIWNFKSPNDEPIVLRDHKQWVWQAVFDREGDRIWAGDRGGILKSWPTTLSMLSRGICQRLRRNLTSEEWENYIGSGIEHEKTCSKNR